MAWSRHLTLQVIGKNKLVQKQIIDRIVQTTLGVHDGKDAGQETIGDVMEENDDRDNANDEVKEDDRWEKLTT